MAAAKIDKTDYAKIKSDLKQGINTHKVTEGLKIVCLRPGPAERVDVVFETEEQADKARQHKGWVTSSAPGTRIQPAQWGVIKLDGVPKVGTLQDDGKTVVETFAETFKRDNASNGVDSTVMQVRWLSRPDPLRKLGSLVVWLRSKAAAAQFLSCGTAMLGAVGVFCSRYEARNTNLPCFNCGDYRHKQAACKKAKRCAICSEGHDWRACKNQANPKCPTCNGSHRAFDRECQYHPEHRRYLARQKTGSAEKEPATEQANGIQMETWPTHEVEMRDTPASSS
jgi:hypothetical protein